MKPQYVFLLLCIMATAMSNRVMAQKQSPYMRMAIITVEEKMLTDYLNALRTQMNTALKSEKGVLSYVAVQDKKEPFRITILETYASMEAYQEHIRTEHFKKYKAAVEGMVKQLELKDVVSVAMQ